MWVLLSHNGIYVHTVHSLLFHLTIRFRHISQAVHTDLPHASSLSRIFQGVGVAKCNLSDHKHLEWPLNGLSFPGKRIQCPQVTLESDLSADGLHAPSTDPIYLKVHPTLGAPCHLQQAPCQGVFA